MRPKPKTFSELFQEAERHEDYWLAGAILAFTENIVREMERQGITRTELARRLGATPAYVTKILRGKVNFTLATMTRLSRALGAELTVQLTSRVDPPTIQAVTSSRKVTRAAKSVRTRVSPD
jgi:transcriptional regulator with XRE-family HTH domain